MDSRIWEALETARDDFHTLAMSKEGDFDELGLRSFGSICEGQMIRALSLITAEPAPCDDAYSLVKKIISIALPNQITALVVSNITSASKEIEVYASTHKQSDRADETRRFIAYLDRIFDIVKCVDYRSSEGGPSVGQVVLEAKSAILQGTEPYPPDEMSRLHKLSEIVNSAPAKVSEDVERDAEIVRLALTYVKAVALGDDSVFENGIAAFDSLVSRLKEGNRG